MRASSATNARPCCIRVPDLLRAMAVRRLPGRGRGCGKRLPTVRLAAAVGMGGRVYAVDIVPDVLQRLRDRVSKASLANVVVIEGTASDPRLPLGAVDAIVMVNAYHEVTDTTAVLGAFHGALKQGGRLVLCEPRPTSADTSRVEQVKSRVLSPELIAQELTAAVFEITSRDHDFTANPSGGQNAPYSLVVATKR